MEVDHSLDYGVVANPDIGDDPAFLTGHLIGEDLPTLVFEVNFPKDARLPHFLGYEIPLVSGELIQVFKATGIDNFQIFPARLTNSETGQFWDDFFAFNVLGLIRAANLEYSDFDVLMDGGDDSEVPALLAFREIALDKDKIPSAVLMFRMAEDPGNLIVHEQLVKLLFKNRPEDGWGIDLIEVDLF